MSSTNASDAPSDHHHHPLEPTEKTTTRSSSNSSSSVAPTVTPAPSRAWVHFDDEAGRTRDAAVISAESVQVNLERSFSEPSPAPNNQQQQQQPNNAAATTTSAPTSVIVDPKNLRNIELSADGNEPVVRQGFANGDVVVTLLPVNTGLPWITPAKFRPELVPEELMAQGLTLTVEEYVQTMELLVNDVRFTLYNVCYKRVLVAWIALAFVLLLALLFSGLSGLALFGVGVFWLVVNAAAIFLSMWAKFRLQRGLERCLATVNRHLLRHKLVVTLDDRGRLSCHKVALCFIYLDAGACVAHLQRAVDDAAGGWERRLDVGAADIVVQGGGGATRTTRLSRKQERAALLHLRYAARWGKERVRGYLASPPAKGGRHCAHLTCPCQYIEDHLQCKPAGKLTLKSFCCLPDQVDAAPPAATACTIL